MRRKARICQSNATRSTSWSGPGLPDGTENVAHATTIPITMA
jgi:hypothetical protein